MIVRDLFIALGLKFDDAGFKKAEGVVRNLVGGLAKVGVIATGAAAALVGVIKATSDAALSADRAARSLGLSTQSLQELEFAGTKAGVSSDEVRASLTHLAHEAYIAATRGGHAAEAFYRLGVQVRGLDGRARPLEQILNDVSDRLGAIQNPVERAALGMQVLGSAALVNGLGEGSAKLEQYREEARRLGVVMSDQLVAKGKAFSEQTRVITARVKALAFDVASRVLPSFIKAAGAVERWVSANKDLIASGVQRVFEVIAHVVQLIAAHKGVFLAIGVVMLAWISPLTIAMGALLLILDDVFGYFNGKNSVTGLLMEALDDFLDAFEEDPFGTLYVYAKGFFDWFIDQAKKIPERLADAMVGTGTRGLNQNVVGPGGVNPASGPVDWTYLFHVAFREMSKWLIGPPPPGLGLGPAAGFVPGGASINLSVNVAAGLGADGKQIGDQAAFSIRTELERWWAEERSAVWGAR